MIEIPVNLASRAYRIIVGGGARADVGAQLAKLSVGRRVALLTDATIRRLHGEPVTRGLVAAGFEVTEVLLPEGEQAKTLDVLREVWDDLLEAGCDRTSTVVAVGGGAVGDLAGFAAATYMRGSISSRSPPRCSPRWMPRAAARPPSTTRAPRT